MKRPDCVGVRLVLGACILLSATGSGAHHSIALVFDDSRRVSVSGVVTGFSFVDPHSGMTLEVTSSDGGVATWHIEMTARFTLVSQGWTERTVVPGDRVTVTGWPARSDARRLFARSLLSADGTELMKGSVRRDYYVEEYRRQRLSGEGDSKPANR